MPPRNKVMLLPDHTRRELDNRLVNGGFAGYEALEEWLAEQGFEIGKSSLHRYGTDLSRRMAAIKASTEAAVLIADSCKDDEDKRSGAILSLVQTELFNSLIALQDAGNETSPPAERLALMAKAGKGIADVVKASGLQKKWAVEVNQPELASAMKVVQKLADFVRLNFPQHSTAFAEILEPFGDILADSYGP